MPVLPLAPGLGLATLWGRPRAATQPRRIACQRKERDSGSSCLRLEGTASSTGAHRYGARTVSAAASRPTVHCYPDADDVIHAADGSPATALPRPMECGRGSPTQLPGAVVCVSAPVRRLAPPLPEGDRRSPSGPTQISTAEARWSIHGAFRLLQSPSPQPGRTSGRRCRRRRLVPVRVSLLGFNELRRTAAEADAHRFSSASPRQNWNLEAPRRRAEFTVSRRPSRLPLPG